MSRELEALSDDELVVALMMLREQVSGLLSKEESDAEALRRMMVAHDELLRQMVARPSLHLQIKDQLLQSRAAMEEWQPALERALNGTRNELKKALKGTKMLKAYGKSG